MWRAGHDWRRLRPGRPGVRWRQAGSHTCGGGLFCDPVRWQGEASSQSDIWTNSHSHASQRLLLSQAKVTTSATELTWQLLSNRLRSSISALLTSEMSCGPICDQEAQFRDFSIPAILSITRGGGLSLVRGGSKRPTQNMYAHEEERLHGLIWPCFDCKACMRPYNTVCFFTLFTRRRWR